MEKPSNDLLSLLSRVGQVASELLKAVRAFRTEYNVDRSDIQSKDVGTSPVKIVDGERKKPRRVRVSTRLNYLFLTHSDRGTSANANTNGLRINVGSSEGVWMTLPATHDLWAVSSVASNKADLIIQDWDL